MFLPNIVGRRRCGGVYQVNVRRRRRRRLRRTIILEPRY